MNDTTRLVVGVDGSDHAKRALRWALDEARRRNVRLEVIHAWSVPYRFVGLERTLAIPMDAERDRARSELDATIQAVVTDPADRARVDPTLVAGSAAVALVDASKTAGLVVVGARGVGGFLGLLLGSTANQVVVHAACPVVVIPGAPETTAAA
jgi:nucleotide-binding universal stress UspA family protein